MQAIVDPLYRPVFSALQVRELDRIAIEEFGVPGYALMTRAGRAALDVLAARWPTARTLEIYCGAGNNAGDGYVVARLACAAGYAVRVLALIPPDRLRGDARRAAEDCHAAGVSSEPFAASAERIGPAADVVVDALLGTGLDRPVAGPFADAVAHINASGCPVLALDVPSGLDATTGEVHGDAVRATVTVTFVGLKQGLFVGAAPDYRGTLEFSSLDIPADIPARLTPPLETLEPALLRAVLPPRRRSAHKGSNGRVLLIGGGPGMSGAIRLAAEAALRVGAGLVHVATHRDSVVPVLAGRPELMCRAVEQPHDLDSWLDAADVVVIGPGLGQSDWARALYTRTLAAAAPRVIDADALNLLARAPAVSLGRAILTPHPGEAARLLGRSTAAVQADRLGAVRALAERYGAVTVLKGACTLVAPAPRDEIVAAAGEGRAPAPGAASSAAPVAVCAYGNPGMATGGTGDVLAGVLGGLVAQLGDLHVAARAGVLLHALAGDSAARDGERGLVAGDLLAELRRGANP